MKKQVTLVLLGAVMTCASLIGCSADIDLQNIDPSAKIEMGIALPVGEFSVSIGNLLGDSSVRQISIDEQGIYQFADTFDFSQELQVLDMSTYTCDTTMTFPVAKELTGFPIPGGQSFVLDFPVSVRIDNINKHPESERIDSIVMQRMHFFIEVDRNFDLSYNDIEKMEFVLPSDIRRAAGNIVNIPLEGGGFGQQMVADLDGITISLMQDASADPGAGNTKNTLDLSLRIFVRLSPDQTMIIPSGSTMSLHLRSDEIQYDGVYGYFTSKNDWRESDTIVISDAWEGYHKIRSLHVSLGKPSIGFNLTTSIAVPFRASIEQLGVENKDHSARRNAEFNGSGTCPIAMPNFVKATDPWGTTATNTACFDNANGGIGRLAEIHPEYLYYSFLFSTDEREDVKQHRITRFDSKIEGKATLLVPFTLNEGTQLEYLDTASLNLSVLNLDSVFASIEQVDSLSIRNLHLMLTLSNRFPFAITSSFRFMNASHEILPIHTLEENILRVSGPTQYSSNGSILAPGKGYVDLAFSREDISLLQSVRYIEYDIHMEDDQALPDSEAIYPVSLSRDCGLDFKIALTANVAAYLNLVFKK